MTHCPRRSAGAGRIAGLLLGLAFGSPPVAAQSLALTGATVIDVTGGPSRTGTTVVIRDGVIVSLEADGTVSLPEGVRRIDLGGRYVIPGLWDMHVHLASAGAEALRALLAHGVTSVRDLGGDLPQVARWRVESRAGTLLAPRIRTAGAIVENAAWLARASSLDVPGLREMLADRIPVETAADAVRAADSLARLGVDLVKLRNSPRPEAFAALLARARHHGLPVAAHQPSRAIGLGGALAAGLRSLEHMELLGELGQLPPGERDSLLRAMAAADFWITPTLITSMGRFLPDRAIEARAAGDGSPLDRLVSPALRGFWRQQLGMRRFDAPRDFYERGVRTGLAGLRAVIRGGVKLLAGTDLGALLVYPGASLHDELALLVDSLGLSPAAALRAATLEPARFFGVADRAGTVAAGREADLVVLEADPLADIRHTRRIAGVVSRGRWLVPAELLAPR